MRVGAGGWGGEMGKYLFVLFVKVFVFHMFFSFVFTGFIAASLFLLLLCLFFCHILLILLLVMC